MKQLKDTKKGKKLISLGYNGWMLNATQEEIDNCICSEWDGKGVSCCGFPCPVHNRRESK